MRVRKKYNFSPSSLSRFHTSDDSRIAEMGPGRLERPEGDEEPSVLPPRSPSDQVVHLWNRRCTREHHGKKWDFFVAESDEELESTSVFFQMKQFTFLSLRQLVYSSTLATMKKSYTDASPEWFPKQTECIF